MWAERGEWILGAFAVLYLLTMNAAIAIGGFFLAGVPGLISVRRMWVGREEFGPVHEKAARRGTYLFAVAALLFLLAYASSGTFASATQRFDPAQNETLSTETAHRFKDLIPSLGLVTIALVLETASGAHFLWELVGTGWRRYAAAYAGLGAASAIIVFSIGFDWIRTQRELIGERVDSAATADYYFRYWTETVLPALMLAFLVTRAAAIVLLRRAQAKVLEAEALPPEQEAPSAPAPSP